MFKYATAISIVLASMTTFTAQGSSGACDPGEIVIKFSHVTNTVNTRKVLRRHYLKSE